MPRKSIPAIPVGVLRVHGAHSVFRLFRIFNYFFSRAISPSAAGISRALSQSVLISIFHFAVLLIAGKLHHDHSEWEPTVLAAEAFRALNHPDPILRILYPLL